MFHVFQYWGGGGSELFPSPRAYMGRVRNFSRSVLRQQAVIEEEGSSKFFEIPEGSEFLQVPEPV